jgi:hypothetical protein
VIGKETARDGGFAVDLQDSVQMERRHFRPALSQPTVDVARPLSSPTFRLNIPRGTIKKVHQVLGKNQFNVQKRGAVGEGEVEVEVVNYLLVHIYSIKLYDSHRFFYRHRRFYLKPEQTDKIRMTRNGRKKGDYEEGLTTTRYPPSRVPMNLSENPLSKGAKLVSFLSLITENQKWSNCGAFVCRKKK